MVLGTLDAAFRKFSDMLAQFLPQMLAMLIIIVAGWVVSFVLKIIIRRMLELLKINRLSKDSGLSMILRKADLPPASELISRLVFWVSWIGFLLLGIDALGVEQLQEQVSRFLLFLPQIFVALLILFVGFLAANFFSRAALLAAVNANLASARLIGSLVRFVIVLLTISMALEQIALAQRTVLITFSIAFGGIMLGLAIAFGIGGRDVAHHTLERLFPGPREQKEEEKVKHDEMSPL
jgi:hypothetical protein